jgi:hypothetical protein
MTAANIEVPTEEIAAMCRRNGVRRLALFGSVLTGRFSEHSDIDVLIEFRPNERVGFFRLADIQDELSRLLDGRTVDLRTPMDLSRYFREEVLRDASVVYAEPRVQFRLPPAYKTAVPRQVTWPLAPRVTGTAEMVVLPSPPVIRSVEGFRKVRAPKPGPSKTNV